MLLSQLASSLEACHQSSHASLRKLSSTAGSFLHRLGNLCCDELAILQLQCNVVKRLLSLYKIHENFIAKIHENFIQGSHSAQPLTVQNFLP